MNSQEESGGRKEGGTRFRFARSVAEHAELVRTPDLFTVVGFKRRFSVT